MKEQYFISETREGVMQVRLRDLAESFAIRELDLEKDNYLEVITKIHEALSELKPERVEEELTEEEKDERVFKILGL